MNHSISIILIPILAGLLLLMFPLRFRVFKGALALLVTLFTCFLAVVIYSGATTVPQAGSWTGMAGLQSSPDNLSRLIILFMALLSMLIAVYSLAYKGQTMRNFHAWFLVTLGFSFGAVLANNLLLFLVCWGILGITLYLLVNGNSEAESATAKKTLVMIGASDGIMILGVAIIWRITGTLNMDEISLGTTDAVRVIAFLSLLAGSFTKAGAFPFHTWIPDYAEHAPSTSSAFLPASLDKLLGIYFLARITTGLFTPGEWMRLIILSIGVITIITSVLMALVQHNYKRLLGFHAVSQVGYMVVGFGLGSVIGIAGGLFHMINHAIYKSGLFLTAGAIEQQTGKAELDEVGGLSKVMPFTFVTTLVFALSISGIPPFNGFASKWMIYQGIIDFGHGAGIASRLWVIWLGLAVLGSALTLASFIKFTGGIFMGRQRDDLSKVTEVSPVMWIPAAILALICIGFGVFATTL
jgi:formate hydrogenlyase subunit 3/multisubunit Na+/H+ antiporter MnhD subunit